MRRRFFWSLSVALFAVIFAATCQAAEWKPKKLEIIIPHEVGSTSDATTRLIGKYWTKYMPGVQLIYINKGQAGGRLGYDQFARSKRDGTVIMSCNIQTAAILYAQQKPDWKWEEVIYPINVYDMDPAIIQVRMDSPYKNLEELIEAAKKSPLNAGLSRWATTDTLVLYQLMDYTGAKFEVIPLGSGSKSRAGLLGGHVDLNVRRASDMKISAGQIRPLAICLPTNPIPHVVGDIPTVTSVVKKPIVSAGSYRAFVTHPEVKKNYPERFKVLYDTLSKVKKDPGFIEEAQKLGFELMDDMAPEELIEMSEELFPVFEKYADVYKKNQ